MKKCDVCNKEELIQYRVKSINYKSWIFCCTDCWHIVSKQDQYAYGGTRKSKKSQETRKDELNLSEKHQLERAAVWQSAIENQRKIKEGYIYILSNKKLPKIYKIGFVKEDVEKRAYSLKRETGLETDFVIEKIWKTKNPFEVEQKIFESLIMPTNEKGEFDSSLGKCYRTSKFINGKRFTEFVEGASLKFFCKRIEEFIQV